MSEKNITAATGKTIDLVPAAVGDVPEILDQLIAAAPGPLQASLREALKKAAFLNPGDPVFELVLVLELIGVYYQRIAARVTKAGADMDAKNTAVLVSLDDRVRKLQGLGQIIQQATDRLETIAPDIVERFPIDQIVRQVAEKMDARIRMLPIENLENSLAKAHGTMHTVANAAENNATRITNASNDIEKAAAKIEAVKLPRVSIGWAVLWLAIGATITGLAFSIVISRSLPEAKRVLPFVKTDESGMKIVVPKGAYHNATQEPDEGELTIPLNP